MRTSPEDFKAPGRAAERAVPASLNACVGSTGPGRGSVEGLMVVQNHPFSAEKPWGFHMISTGIFPGGYPGSGDFKGRLWGYEQSYDIVLLLDSFFEGCSSTLCIGIVIIHQALKGNHQGF